MKNITNYCPYYHALIEYLNHNLFKNVNTGGTTRPNLRIDFTSREVQTQTEFYCVNCGKQDTNKELFEHKTVIETDSLCIQIKVRQNLPLLPTPKQTKKFLKRKRT